MMMKAAIALLADYEIQNFVRRIVYDLNRQYGTSFLTSLLPAHVSVKQPFAFESMEKLERYFGTLAESTTPIEVELGGVYHGQWSSYGILGLRVKETGALRELHNRINRELSNLFDDTSAPHDGDAYRFHLTIEAGKVEGEDPYKRYYDQMGDRRMALRFTARDIALFYYDDDTTPAAGSFMTYKVLGLGGKRRAGANDAAYQA
jgi:2'-5' RNA ligase